MKKNILLLIMILAGFSLAAQQEISGVITDAVSGEPVIGATVVEQGQPSNGTVTDIDGAFTLTVEGGDASLIISSVGFESQVVPLDGQTELNVTLAEGVTLDEVVVTALGISREKKKLGYAVTEIGSEDITTVKEANPINSLSGRVPGLVITQNASGVGGSSRVVIRGNNSLTGNNQPLFVVDGVPISNSGFGSSNSGSNGSEFSKTDYGRGVNDINPDDIASISVLKGPNAAALYGSRASNGVVLITTKKGRSRKGIGVSLSNSLTFSEPLVLPELQNEYGQGTQGEAGQTLDIVLGSGGSWGGRLDGSQQVYYTGETRAYEAQPDNVRDFFETGTNYVGTVALEGGNENNTFRFSYTYNDQGSILPNAGLTKHNFNIRGLSQISEQLSIDAKVTFLTQDAQNRAVQGTEGLMAYLYDVPRNVRLEDLRDFQNEEDFSVRSTTSSGGNPYWILFNDRAEDNRDRLLGFVKANYEFSDNLSAFVRVGSDATNMNIETVNQAGHWFFRSGRFNFSKQRETETNADFLISYNNDFSESFGLNLNVGGNHRYNTYESSGVSGDDFKIPTKPTAQSAKNLFPGWTPLREKKVNSLYAAATLSFGQTLYLDLSARNDWSSTLPPDNWSYFYPSASLAFILSEVLDIDGLDLAKLRVSAAQVGGDTDPYQLNIAFNLQQNGYLGRTTLSRPSLRLNPNLQPEKVTSYEAGIEFRLAGNRVYGDFSVYNIVSEDLIMDIPVPQATGYSAFRTNVGELTNTGYEVQLGFVPVNTADLNWDLALNLSGNKNKLNSLAGDLDRFNFSGTNSGVVRVQATVGGEFGEIFGTDYLRTDDGRIVVNSEGFPRIDPEPQKLGNYQPDLTAGLSSYLTYKNINFRFLIDGRFGGALFSGTDAGLVGSGVAAETVQYREDGIVVDGVVNVGTEENPEFQENDVRITGQQYWGNYAGVASNFVYAQDNIRLREVSLTYKLPRSLLENVFVQDLSIGLIGRNLFFFSKDLPNFDPESSYSTTNFAQGILYYSVPQTRNIGLNLNVTF